MPHQIETQKKLPIMSRLGIATLAGITGICMMLTLRYIEDGWLLGAGLGAFGGGLALGPWLGHQGWMGLLKALMAVITMTALGGCVAGAFISINDIAFGGFFIMGWVLPILVITGKPVSGLIWVIGMAACHGLAYHSRGHTGKKAVAVVP